MAGSALEPHQHDDAASTIATTPSHTLANAAAAAAAAAAGAGGGSIGAAQHEASSNATPIAAAIAAAALSSSSSSSSSSAVTAATLLDDATTSHTRRKASVTHAMIVILIEFACVGLIMPIIPSVMNNAFGNNVFLVSGLSQGVKGILAFFSAPAVGALSDVYGRKPFLLLSVLFTCLPIPLLFFANLWPYVIAMTFSGLFAVTFSVVFAYATDITTEDERNSAYGKISAMFAASLVLSPLVGSVMSKVFGNDAVYQLACLLAFADLFYIYVYVPESLSFEKLQRNQRALGGRSSLSSSTSSSSIPTAGAAAKLHHHPSDGNITIPAAAAASIAASDLRPSPSSGSSSINGSLHHLHHSNSHSYNGSPTALDSGLNGGTLGHSSDLRGVSPLEADLHHNHNNNNNNNNNNNTNNNHGRRSRRHQLAGLFRTLMDKGDPLRSLKTVVTSPALLQLSLMVFLSYLPEAGEQMLMLQYLGARFHFTVYQLASFIAGMGILSVFAQTSLLSYCHTRFGDMLTIQFGLALAATQLVWYGVASLSWMMYGAGALAALSTLCYPAISALVSKHAPPDQQGAVQGMITGVRMLCNGLGPLLFGLLFDIAGLQISEYRGHSHDDDEEDDDDIILHAGLPFLVGAVLVLVALALSTRLRLGAPSSMSAVLHGESSLPQLAAPGAASTSVPPLSPTKLHGPSVGSGHSNASTSGNNHTVLTLPSPMVHSAPHPSADRDDDDSDAYSGSSSSGGTSWSSKLGLQQHSKYTRLAADDEPSSSTGTATSDSYTSKLLSFTRRKDAKQS
ncbi:hippocampus abundant transcript 1 protein [Capsaspora owczarzaki ATCC 30864]|uniref:Hippocampus abundant transcript 1 protein n=1 Tax=Capsaspora owczarzaki (strain ATCC 30864) TaxID=595528 RepID=A0A0D2VUX7_CAPO3|nr:hippocampus abundant transcript 1 protein [Capsaspora owczarzaki ATCC 30864]KJE95202.1 hippocampus abundant transcript 1 protein [Capsaspora owczarzaki ATCC 30864]|eukprot:XP_004346353.1 hippocampus abundant transcript 1 protein [Capsaspora owczarzaki ATCC 30864]